MNDNRFWVLIVAIITFGIVSLFSIGALYHADKHENMMKYGYEYTTLPGQNGNFLHKVEK